MLVAAEIKTELTLHFSYTKQVLKGAGFKRGENMMYKKIILWVIVMLVMNCDAKKNIKIILGSTRQGRSSEKIGQAIKKITDKRSDAQVDIVDLQEYNLPFLYEEISPSKRTKVTDPAIKKWSDTISAADGFIIVVPSYNSGYPGVLKNALDLLYKEWNNKPVALVGYSGGKKGGVQAVTALKSVLEKLQMKLVSAELLIPTERKAINSRGQFDDYKRCAKIINSMIDQLIAA